MIDIDELVRAVRANPRYRAIDADLVRRLARQEMEKGRNVREAVRAVRGKLHQVGGAYQEGGIDYGGALKRLAELPSELNSLALRGFCRDLMQQHASTRERLPSLETFYERIFEGLAPIQSLLDLACGLNPLARPWMPLAPAASYIACDIYADMTAFIQTFFGHIRQPGRAELCDLTQALPGERAQVALLLKTLPCLEQLDKNIGARLLESVPADTLLVSFPGRSLGGRSKGMPQNYSAHFEALTNAKPWQIERFDFENEIVFRVRK